MRACRIEGQQVIPEDSLASVWRQSWRKLVNAKKIGTTVAVGVKFAVVVFETKSGAAEDAINSPGGAWMLDQAEAASFGFWEGKPRD